MLGLSIGALVIPVALHLQLKAEAAAPQIAMRGEVSSVRPIHLEMGFAQARAEAAFFDGLARPAPLSPEADSRPMAKDAEAVTESAGPAMRAPEIVAPSDSTIDRLLKPNVRTALTDLPEPQGLDTSIDPPESDLPPFVEVPAAIEVEPEPVVVYRLAPKTSPLPLSRPYLFADPVPQDTGLESPTLPEGEIDVLPLPPMTDEAEEGEERQIIPMNSILDFDVLPTDVTPDPESAPEAGDVIARAEPKAAAPSEAPKADAAKPEAEKAPSANGKGPKIAIVIAAAGLNEGTTRYAIETLPSGVTLAFAPVKSEATALSREAKADGHSVLVEIPLEPVNRRRDPGPLTLRVDDTPEQNLDRLAKALKRIPVADGASTYLGARFNADPQGTATLVKALAERDMSLFENEPTARSLFGRTASQSGVPYARGVEKIDRDRSEAAIRLALDDLERQARVSGSAVGVGTALRTTISTVASWAEEAEKRGVRLVPVLEVAR